MLKIQFKDRRKPAMWLVESSINIGKDSICDIVIDDPDLQGVHCALVVDREDITLINLSGNKSIFVNDIPVAKDHVLVAWDVVRIGNSELEIIDPLAKRSPASELVEANKTVIRPAMSAWMLKANSEPLTGQFFPINHAFTIGRDDRADIIVPLNFISRIHTRLTIKNDKLLVEDAGSSNGTFVNKERIKSCELRNKDVLKLDQFSFTVIGPDVVGEHNPRTIIREKEKIIKKDKKSDTLSFRKPELASSKVFLHDIDETSTGKIYEIVRRMNHLSKMLGHHLSRSEKSVSARHVYLNETDLGWEVVNNGAADGLMVNGKMQSQALLQNDDEITVGGTKLKFQSVGDTPLHHFKPKLSNTPSRKTAVIVVLMIIVMLVLIFS